MGLPTMSLRPTTTACWPVMDGNSAALQHLNDSRRSAGNQRGLAALRASDLHRMKSVHIFLGRDGFEQSFWRLRGRAAATGSGFHPHRRVQRGNQGQRYRRRGGRRGDGLAVDPQCGTGFHLVSYVHLGGGVMADQHHGQPGRIPCRWSCCQFVGHVCLDRGRNGV